MESYQNLEDPRFQQQGWEDDDDRTDVYWLTYEDLDEPTLPGIGPGPKDASNER